MPSIIRAGAVLVAAALVAGCQSARTSDQEEKQALSEKQALEKRVEELERQLAARNAAPPATAEAAAPATAAPAVAAPTPAAVTVAPKPKPYRPAARRPAPAVVERAPIDRAPVDPVDDDPDTARAGVTMSAKEPAVIETSGGAAPEPVRTPEPIVLARGTQLALRLESALSSENSREGDAVLARVEGATGPAGDVALPGGTLVKGRVVEARESGRVKGRARIAVVFDRIVVRGTEHPLETIAVVETAKSAKKRDAAMIGGGAAIGAFLGAVTGGNPAKGAAIGAGAGTGAVLATKGEEIYIPAGARWNVEVSRTLRF
jgi:outer membrane murein-binding lipoprotein Lpp